MDKELKKEVWELLEGYKENLSDEIGWGTMDSLCEELINTIKNQSEELLNYHRYLKKELNLDLSEIWVNEYLKQTL
tara:strand:- start:51 stop:278 length:228 start_codon:yes stop_codon:yes gene_type:complete